MKQMLVEHGAELTELALLSGRELTDYRACPVKGLLTEQVYLARVDRINCVGCGACVDACPKNIVKLIPEKQKIMPACSNTEKGAQVMKVCKVGCIGCMKCQRECPADAIVVKDNLAQVDPAKCVQCGHCADICPRHIISFFGPEYKNC